jgi:hypothetical protein
MLKRFDFELIRPVMTLTDCRYVRQHEGLQIIKVQWCYATDFADLLTV